MIHVYFVIQNVLENKRKLSVYRPNNAEPGYSDEIMNREFLHLLHI